MDATTICSAWTVGFCMEMRKITKEIKIGSNATSDKWNPDGCAEECVILDNDYFTCSANRCHQPAFGDCALWLNAYDYLLVICRPDS
jgi:hypothetical protein